MISSIQPRGFVAYLISHTLARAHGAAGQPVAMAGRCVARGWRRSAGVMAWVFALLGAVGCAQAAAADDDIEKQLLDLFQTTKVTADGSAIVTPGVELALQKDGLLMNPLDVPVPMSNVYQDGRIKGLAGAKKVLDTVANISGHLGFLNPFAGKPQADLVTGASASTRTFVTGEKFWVTKIETGATGVTFTFYSGPFNDKRYHGTLQFPFPKGSKPAADDVTATVAEVLKIDAGDSAQGQKAAANATPQQAAPAAPASRTIAIGQSRDEVIAALGVPSQRQQSGPAEVDIYPDKQVVFFQNRVVDIR